MLQKNSLPQVKNVSFSLSGAVAKSVLCRLPISAQKLNVVARSVRGVMVEKALASLRHSPRKAARFISGAVLSAVANASNNDGKNPDALFVLEMTVGRSTPMKRLDIKGRSRSGRIEKPFSRLRVVLAEKMEGK